MVMLHLPPFLHCHSSSFFSTPTPLFPSRFPRSKKLPPRPHSFSVTALSQTPFQFGDSYSQTPQPTRPKTLYPSGFKRPEIKVPNLVLQLEPEQVLGDGDALDFIDRAISRWVGIVVLNGGEGNGGKVYEAACKLKSVVKDRAYLLITERVDIAAAVNASGVVLSDQGLPAIVARNTMLDSISESLFLPLVARVVKSTNSAINASNSEGADFLLYGLAEEEHSDNSVFKNVKIPIFIIFSVHEGNKTIDEALKLLMFGASGFVMSLEVMKLFSDETLNELFDSFSIARKNSDDDVQTFDTLALLDIDINFVGTRGMAGFAKLEDREKHFIEVEKSVLLEAIKVIKRAAPLMEEVSLLTDAVSRLDEPFMLAIVGEFNSGKSSVINALLGSKYLKEGVVPTTNEITFLRYSESTSSEPQRCERLPDGQYICYLPAPILKEMNIVDTPGTNVILQRQQRLTEEFVPRADLLLFVISADRPLTESEVVFLRYTQQWKKKVVFVLNKSDLYQNTHELEDALSFIKQNAEKMLNTGTVTVYPVSARSALNEKLSAFSDSSKNHGVGLSSDSLQRSNGFHELEEFLYSFLDGSTSRGMERMKLKLQTPIGIAERLLSACKNLVQQDCLQARQDLASVNELVGSVRKYTTKMESESISWKRRVLSLIDSTKLQIMRLVESSLQLSNLDLVTSFVLKGEGADTLKAGSNIQSGIIGPAKSDARKLLQDYVAWLRSSNSQEGMFYKESFEKQWPSIVPNLREQLATYELLKKVDEISLKEVENFSTVAASKLFEQKIREMFLGTFGGLGAAGLSASLLTSVLPTTLEDLLALGLCSAGGFLAISNFPSRRQELIGKVKKTAEALGRELEEAMQEDLVEANKNMVTFVSIISKPYIKEAQRKVGTLLELESELTTLEKKLETLQVGIQNLHVS